MSTTDASIPDCTQVTIYHVVALQSAGPETIVPCLYFNADWAHVKANGLITAENSNCIRFVDCGSNLPVSIIEEIKNNWWPSPDFGVSLFAAVAKTFKVNCGLSTTFTARNTPNGERFIDIPVARFTTRGVVLVFSKQTPSGTERIIATADPEIRNGSGLDN